MGIQSRSLDRVSKLRCMLFIGLMASASTAIAQTSMEPYFPLDSGNQWSYSDGRSELVLDSTESVNGVATRILENQMGNLNFLTNDGTGLLVHGSIDPSGARITFTPPMQLAPGLVEVGETYSSSGAFTTVDQSGGVIATGDFTSTTEVVGFETVTVPAGTFEALHLRNSIVNVVGGVTLDTGTVDLWYAKNTGSIRETRDSSNSELVSTNVTSPSADDVTLAASVLPGSRSVQVGDTATAFATVINASSELGIDCKIAPVTPVPATFSYQTTDPATNSPIGSSDTPIDINPGEAQTFLFAFTPNSAFDPTNVVLSFDCANSAPAGVAPRLNTLLLSGSDTAGADIVALGATASGDGILQLTGGAGAFSVATVNVGVGDAIEARALTGAAGLPITLAVCETDPTTGACVNPPTPADAVVSTTIDENETPTFAIFATASGDIAADPLNNRIVVEFVDSSGAVRGATSVAVQTTP